MSKSYPCDNCGVARPAHNHGLCRDCRQRKGKQISPFRPSTVRTLSDVEAAWIGAMVEGEGSVTIRTTPSGLVRPHAVMVYSSEVETIATCLRLVGAGTIDYRPPRPDYVSPRGRRAFATKDNWVWRIQNINGVLALLPQILPFLTSRRERAELAIFAGTHHCPAISGSSCHPSHFEAPAPAGMSEEQIAKNWEGYNKGKGIDPRAIDKHFKFKPGHEVDYDEPDSGWKYVDVKFEGEDADPDQRDMLHGGPAVAMDCDRCGTQLHAVGRMSSWDVMNQPGVSLVNIDRIDETRRKELQEEKVVVLACPNCKKKWQWLEEFLPKGAYDAQE